MDFAEHPRKSNVSENSKAYYGCLLWNGLRFLRNELHVLFN